jgi:biotin carboxylase
MTDERFHKNLRVAALFLRQAGASLHNNNDRDLFADAAVDVDAARQRLARLESEAPVAAAKIERLDARYKALEELAAERLSLANKACDARDCARQLAERLAAQLHAMRAKWRAARAEVRVLTRSE